MNPLLCNRRRVSGVAFMVRVALLSIALACAGSVTYAADKGGLKGECTTTVSSCRATFAELGWQCANIRVGKPMGNGLCQCECGDPGGAIKVTQPTPR